MNTKIVELQNKMYQSRKHPTIGKTIKRLTCITYGNSINTHQKLKKIYSKDIQNTIEYQGKHVVKYNDKYVTIMRDIYERY